MYRKPKINDVILLIGNGWTRDWTETPLIIKGNDDIYNPQLNCIINFPTEEWLKAINYEVTWKFGNCKKKNHLPKWF